MFDGQVRGGVNCGDMPRYPETRALLEQAMRHVLAEQAKLLKRSDSAELVNVIALLNDLAISTSNTLAEGSNRVKSTSSLTSAAKKIEKCVDDVSESLWTPILVSVSAIYQRIEDSLTRKEGQAGLIADIRAHYHNLRIRLLEQSIGARMLVGPSDLGDEHERTIWVPRFEFSAGGTFAIMKVTLPARLT